MTEKELLYFEDAIGHTSNIKKILDDFIEKTIDDKIKDFFQEEKSKIINLNDDLTNTLGGKANE